jgi:hypothetical protein
MGYVRSPLSTWTDPFQRKSVFRDLILYTDKTEG